MKASVATAILAFCASNAVAAPAAEPQNDAVEKREPVFALPIAAKVGIKAGLMAGKKIFFDKREVQEVEKREAEPVWALPLAAKVGWKAGLLAGKKIFFDKRDLEESEKRDAFIEFKPFDDDPFNPFDDPGVIGKRDPALPLAAKVGIKAGLQLGKELFFDDKKKRDAFIEFKPFDDDPFNPFDDPGVIGKRDPALPLAAKVGIKAGLQLGKELFFDKNKRDALTVAEGSDVPTEWDGIPGDDLPEKREADPNVIENALRWWAKEATDDDPMNPFDDPGLPGKRNAEANPNVIENALRWWAKEATDDDPMNPFDDPGLPGKRDAQPQGGFKAGLNNAIQWWGKEVQDDSPINPFDDKGLPGKREAEPFIKDVLNKVIPQDKNDDTSFNPLDGTLNIFKREAEAEPFIKDVLNKVIPQDKNDDTSFNPLDGTLNIFKA